MHHLKFKKTYTKPLVSDFDLDIVFSKEKNINELSVLFKLLKVTNLSSLGFDKLFS